MIRRQPVLVLLAVGFIVLFMGMNYFQVRQSLIELFTIEHEEHEAKLNDVFDLSRNLGNAGQWDRLHEKLDTALLAKDVDYFVLQADGMALWYGDRSGHTEDLVNFNFSKTDILITSPTDTFQTLSFPDGYRLTIGQYKEVDKFMSRAMKKFNAIYIDQGIYVLILLLAVGLWSLRDIRAIVRGVRSGKVNELAKMKGGSAESDIFLRGLAGFQQSVGELQQANALMGRQILPSLKKEIFSGKTPPYDFDCTLVRTDINNFSTIYNSHDVTQFMGTINEFFIEVSHLVTRYGGLIHEFVGDEVLIYFKDEDHPNSFMVALSALRDIGEIAQRFHERTTAERGYPFTVKSSLAHGRVRFGPLVNGYTVAGSVLIETVRVLAHIHEKDGNVIFFDQTHAHHLAPGTSHREALRVHLKGFNGERTLSVYQSHQPLSEILDHLTESNVASLGYYRSDRHLSEILASLRENEAKLSENVILSAIHRLRAVTVTKSEFDFADFLCSWSDELTSVDRAPEPRSLRIAASLVMLMIPLVPLTSFRPEIAERLKILLEVGDRRIVANVLEVLTHFGSADETRAVQTLDSVADSRISANALVHEGRLEITGRVVKKIKGMMRSRRHDQVASALYALGEIALYHRKRDAVYFSTQVGLQDLITRLPKFVTHEDLTVRRQAFVAATKVADVEIIAAMWAASEGSPRIMAEARLHLPPKPRIAS